MMPDTYTKEQIDDAKQFLLDSDTIKRHVTIIDDGEPDTPVRVIPLSDSLAVILSALSTAEQERELYEASIDGWKFRATYAEAQCAKLEARLQGAGWISIKERLPEGLQHVLCINARGTPFVAVYINKFFNDEYRLLRDPTHWMPLPEPPAILGEKKE